MPAPVRTDYQYLRDFVDAILAWVNAQDAVGATNLANAITSVTGQITSVSSASTSGLADKAPLNSPALTGTPTAPTPSGATNDNRIATTAFVQGLIAGLQTQINGKASSTAPLAGLPGPYASDAAAASGGVAVGNYYYASDGVVHRRLS